MKHHLHLPKIGSFWIPVGFFSVGIIAFLLRFFENPIEEKIPHLSAIAFLLVVIAFILVWLGF